MNTSKYVPQPGQIHEVPNLHNRYNSVMPEDLEASDMPNLSTNRDKISSYAIIKTNIPTGTDLIFNMDQLGDSVHQSRTPQIQKNHKNSSSSNNMNQFNTPTIFRDDSVLQEIQTGYNEELQKAVDQNMENQ